MSANTKNLRELSVTALESGRITSELMAIAADRLDVQAAQIELLRAALAEIADYWNRDRNEEAMHDACWHAINTAEAALSGEANA